MTELLILSLRLDAVILGNSFQSNVFRMLIFQSWSTWNDLRLRLGLQRVDSKSSAWWKYGPPAHAIDAEGDFIENISYNMFVIKNSCFCFHFNFIEKQDHKYPATLFKTRLDPPIDLPWLNKTSDLEERVICLILPLLRTDKPCFRIKKDENNQLRKCRKPFPFL